MTLARIVQLYSHWLPAHLVAILLLGLKHQISISPKNEPFKCGTLNTALIHCSSFFIITGKPHVAIKHKNLNLKLFNLASRVFIKLILWMSSLPKPDAYEHSLLISILIHGSALAILTFASGGIWWACCFCGNIAYKLLFK